MSSKLLSNNCFHLCLLSKFSQRHHKSVNRHCLRILSSKWSTPKPSSVAETCVSSFPTSVQPFLRLMRLDKPTGALLLMWPGLWSVSLATTGGQWPSLTTLGLFALGSVVMRGAGCVVNDLWDKDYDRRVERTKGRPLASNQLATTDAVVLLGGLSGCGLLILTQFDAYSICLGAGSLLLVVTYPLVKRISHWPQLVLGMTFNWGALLGYSVVTAGAMDWWAVIPLYISGINWTLIYDTIYAHQDRDDDLIVGLKSTAIRFGADTNRWLALFSTSMCASLVVAGVHTGQCWPYYTAVTITALNLLHQISTLDINDRQNCWNKFRQNTQIGVILFIGIALSTYLKTNDTKPFKETIDDYNRNSNEQTISL